MSFFTEHNIIDMGIVKQAEDVYDVVAYLKSGNMSFIQICDNPISAYYICKRRGFNVNHYIEDVDAFTIRKIPIILP